MITAGAPAGFARYGPARSIPASALHAIHRLVEQRHGDALPLHVGEPHLRMPASASEAFVKAIRDGHTAYTDAPGLPVLREAIAERLAGNGAPPPDRVFVTPGSCQAIAAVLQAVARPGGVALLPEVHWPMHLQQVLLAGLEPRFVRMFDDRDAVLAALAEQDDPAVCVLVLNSPANPSGAVLDPEVVKAVHGWAAHRRVWLISDEAYEDFAYEGSPPATAELDLTLPPDERVVFSVHTFSKGWSMTGCRLGYVAVPTAQTAEWLSRVQEATLVSPSTPVQFAGIAALADGEHLRKHHQYVRATRDAVVAALSPDRLLWTVPAGGWYALLDLSAYSSDTDALCRDLLQTTGLALAPGYGFLPPGNDLGHSLVRLTLCEELGLTLEGIRRLRDYLQAR